MDLEGARKRGRGRGVGGAFSPPAAGDVETRGLKTGRQVIAFVAFLTSAFLICGVYRSPLAIIAGASPGMSRRQQRLQGPPVDDGSPPPPPPPPPQQQQQPRSTDDGLQQPRRPVDGADAPFYGIPGVPRDKYLGGLLAASLDERSCLSRYQSAMYRKRSPHKPSPHLVQRLREYEDRHRRCGPHTAPYNRTLQYLKAGSAAPERETECEYVMWTPWGGLGNRILTLASTFLYALLTDWVLLIDRGKDMAGLFCEPFPETTWLLPPGFPIADFDAFFGSHPQSYGNLLRNGKISNDGADGGSPPPFVYVHLGDDYRTEDMQFFCEPDQAVLRRVPWLFVRSDLYFVPGLFLNQGFEPELSRLFPEKETVFHHLGRYLFHPTNKVWEMITTYYRDHLATARERLGIQIRIFNSTDAPFEVVSEQVLNCTLKEKLLPWVDDSASSPGGMTADPKKNKAVLIASLHSGYLEKIRDMYREHPAAGGAVVNVHQPSREEKQHTDEPDHDAKAWAEMNLLSLADVLVTSAWSTFGYVAQGLGGIRPWVLFRPEKGLAPEPTCVRDVSMEPCFHVPPSYVCREKKSGDNGKVVPFVTNCRDVTSGLKLVDRT